MNDRKRNHSTPHAAAAAALGLVATLATGAACVGPFVAILLGVGGVGWLTRYAHLRVPATLLTVALLGYGFMRLYGSACARRSESRGARVLLWTATMAAVVINALEYVVLAHLL